MYGSRPSSLNPSLSHYPQPRAKGFKGERYLNLLLRCLGFSLGTLSCSELERPNWTAFAVTSAELRIGALLAQGFTMRLACILRPDWAG